MTWPKGLALARIGLYVVLALLAYHFLRTVGQGDTALDRWLASGKVEHGTVQKTVAWALQERQKAIQAVRSATILAARSDSAARQFAVLAGAFRAHLDSEHRQPDTAAFHEVERACYNALLLCKARGDSLARADSLDASRADSLKAALLRSDSSLAAGLKVAECRWLILRCPTRVHALELGVGLGLLGSWVLTHR
jgi:hypothetical protein